MRFVRLFSYIFILWALWASFSIGGLYKLDQINPDYQVEDKHLANLVAKRTFSENNGFWDRYFVESCSLYMPNWEKSDECVKAKIYCESLAPRKASSSKNEADIFSSEFSSCFRDNRPSLGPIEWLHASRLIWRGAIYFGIIWLRGGFSSQGDTEEWHKDNRWWFTPLGKWMEKGD